MDELLKKTGYSKIAIQYFNNKMNVGKIENPTISASYTGHCGDTMKFYLKIDSSNIITDAKFEAIGCAGAFTAGSALTKLIKNKSITHARKIGEYEVVNHLEKVPEQKLDCIYLAIKTLDKTLSGVNKNKIVK